VALKIFHAQGSRSLRVIWLAEEMGLDYELIGETFGRASPDLIAANPARALPAVVDGDVAMSESIAIMQYLTATYGPTPFALGPDDPGFPAYLQYLIYGEASLSAFLNPLIGTKLLAPEDQKDNFTANICRTVFRRRVAALTGRLTENSHLAGEAFTAADISVGYALALAERVDLADDYPKPVADYWARLKLRPAFQRAVVR
jgi:glutathione S-transferase